MNLIRVAVRFYGRHPLPPTSLPPAIRIGFGRADADHLHPAFPHDDLRSPRAQLRLLQLGGSAGSKPGGFQSE